MEAGRSRERWVIRFSAGRFGVDGWTQVLIEDYPRASSLGAEISFLGARVPPHPNPAQVKALGQAREEFKIQKLEIHIKWQLSQCAAL